MPKYIKKKRHEVASAPSTSKIDAEEFTNIAEISPTTSSLGPARPQDLYKKTTIKPKESTNDEDKAHHSSSGGFKIKLKRKKKSKKSKESEAEAAMVDPVKETHDSNKLAEINHKHIEKTKEKKAAAEKHVFTQTGPLESEIPGGVSAVVTPKDMYVGHCVIPEEPKKNKSKVRAVKKFVKRTFTNKVEPLNQAALQQEKNEQDAEYSVDQPPRRAWSGPAAVADSTEKMKKKTKKEKLSLNTMDPMEGTSSSNESSEKSSGVVDEKRHKKKKIFGLVKHKTSPLDGATDPELSNSDEQETVETEVKKKKKLKWRLKLKSKRADKNEAQKEDSNAENLQNAVSDVEKTSSGRRKKSKNKVVPLLGEGEVIRF